MDMHLSRKVIIGSNNKDVQKDLDKGVQLGNTYYPNGLEKATGLILQYDKEKERELLCEKKYKDKYNNNKDKNNNNNSNNNNNNGRDDGKNNDKTETVGAVVDQDSDNKNRQVAAIIALINTGYGEDDFYDPEDQEEEYRNDCEAALHENGPVG